MVQAVVHGVSPTTNIPQEIKTDGAGRLLVSTVAAGGVSSVSPQGAVNNPATQGGALEMGVASTNAPAYADGTINPVSLTTGGLLRCTAEGSVANGAADSGNPVKIGGVAVAAIPAALADGSRSQFLATPTGAVISAVAGQSAAAADGQSNTNVCFPISTVAAAATSTPRTGLAVASFLFNGTTWDRQRGDISGAYSAGTIYFSESTVAQAAGATINGPARAPGGAFSGLGTRFNSFVAEAFADQAGTLFVDKSADGGTTWRQVGSIAVVAGTSSTLKVPISCTTYRARFTNGATAQAAFLLTAAFATN